MAETITDILVSYLRENGLEKTMLEHRLIQLWPEAMGEQVARLTGKIEIRNGVLYVSIRSASLRTQLFECRSDVVKKLNQVAGGDVIQDIRFLG